MDPDEALKNAREAAKRIQRVRDADTSDETLDEDDAFDLADAFEALDGWLSKGGFQPAEWHHEPEPEEVVRRTRDGVYIDENGEPI